LVPNSGQAGVVSLRDPSSSVYSKFDYGQGVTLQTEDLVKQFKQKATARSLPTPAKDDASGEGDLLLVEVLYEWMNYKLPGSNTTEEKVLQALEKVSAGDVSPTFLKAIGHLVQKLKGEPRVWEAVLSRPSNKKLEFIKTVAAIPDLEDRISLIHIEFSIQETKETTDDMLKRAEEMLDKLLVDNTQFLQFLACATSLLTSLGSSPNINLSRMLSAFRSYQGKKNVSPWTFLHKHILQAPKPRGLYWVTDFWMFDEQVPAISEADILFLKQSFTHLADLTRALTLSHEKINELLKTAEASIARTEQVLERMHEVVSAYCFTTDPEERTFDAVRKAIIGLRKASVQTVDSLLEEVHNFSLDRDWRQNLATCKTKRESLQKPPSLSLSALRRGNSGYNPSDFRHSDNYSWESPYSLPRDSSPDYFVTSMYAGMAVLTDYTHLQQDVGIMFGTYYGLDYLNHPLPLLVRSVEELKKKHRFYEGEKFFEGDNLQEYKKALKELLDQQYEQLEMEQKVYLTSLQHDSGFF